MRKFLIAVVLFLGVIFIFTRYSEIEAIASTLRKGDWRFLGLALAVQIAWQINLAATYQAIFHVIGIKESLKDMVIVSGAAFFTNIVAPIGMVSGIAVLIDHAKRKGYSTARSALANTLFIEFELIGFFFILALGLAVLVRRDNLNTTEMLATAFLITVASFILGLIVLGIRSEQALEKTLLFLAGLCNRLLMPIMHRALINEERVRGFALEAVNGLQELQKNPKDILAPILLGFCGKLLMLVNLSLMFFAFQVPISIGTVIAGYTIAYLFLIVSPTPAGLGFVEGALTLSLNSMYVPLGTAVVITVAYRAFTFWVPLLFGMLTFRWINSGLALPKRVS